MKKAGDLVDGFFETYGINDSQNYVGFMAAWREIIGERLAPHSRPSDIKGQTLIVAVDHPGWMTHIRMAERDLLKKIGKRFPQLGIVALGFQLVDKLPPPARGKQIIDQAAQSIEGAVKNDPVGSFPESDPAKETHTIPEDKATLFSALAKLRSAMEKNAKDQPG